MENNANHAIANAAAWYETITEQLAALKAACDAGEDDAYEAARDTITESPLSLRVRSEWQNLGESLEPAQFEILLSTGGPALRIVGQLGLYNCPEHSRMEWQDWGTPWTEFNPAESAVLDSWAAQFWFGE